MNNSLPGIPITVAIPDLQMTASQQKYSKLLSSTFDLPSEAYATRPGLYFFMTAGEEEQQTVHVMWGSSQTEATNRLIFQSKLDPAKVKALSICPPWPDKMNGWNAEFSFFHKDKGFESLLERWAKEAVKKYGKSEQTTS
jgi:hypothetical protein